MATTTFALIRTLGGTIGVSIGGAIYTSEVKRRLSDVPGFSVSNFSQAQLESNIHSLKYIQPEELRQQVLHAFTRSLATIWVVLTPLLFAGTLCVFAIRSYTLAQRVERDQNNATQPDEPAGPHPAEALDSQDIEKAVSTKGDEKTMSVKEGKQDAAKDYTPA